MQSSRMSWRMQKFHLWYMHRDLPSQELVVSMATLTDQNMLRRNLHLRHADRVQLMRQEE